MKHLTIEDFRLLLDTPNEACPPEIAGHLRDCALCAAGYELLSAPVTRLEDTTEDTALCPYEHDVYELFRGRLSSARLPLLAHHLIVCGRCRESFDLLARTEKKTPRQARRLKSWLAAAASVPGALTPYRVVNEYAPAASGKTKVIETSGRLRDGSAFTIIYAPEKTVFQMKKVEAENLRLKVYAEGRWLEGWAELDGGQLGCVLPSNCVANIHLSGHAGEGETILTMPYELLK